MSVHSGERLKPVLGRQVYFASQQPWIYMLTYDQGMSYWLSDKMNVNCDFTSFQCLECPVQLETWGWLVEQHQWKVE